MDRVTQIIAVLYDNMAYKYSNLPPWSILLYDYVLTFPLEVEFIWFSTWNYTNVLVLLVRYFPFLSLILAIMNQYMNVRPTGEVMCRAMNTLPTVLIVVTVVLAEVILAIRTWAIWGRNLIVGAIIAISQTATIIAVSILEAIYFKNLRYGPRCTHASTSGTLTWGPYAVMAIFEAIVLVLIMISAFRSYRSGGSGRLSKLVHRDGIMSYIFLFCITTALVLMNDLAPLALNDVLTATLQVMYSVLTVRIIFRIRKAARQSGTEEELHTMLPSVAFASGPEESIISRDLLYQNQTVSN